MTMTDAELGALLSARPEDTDPRLSGQPGDRAPARGHERPPPPVLNAYLDTWAGGALTGAAGFNRPRAAAAMAEQEAADRAWRLQQAGERFELYPDRYTSIEAALRDVPPPARGAGAWLGTPSTPTSVVAVMLSGGDPTREWIVGPPLRDNTTRVGLGATEDGYVIDDPELTRPPWARGD